jgi:hypothetical protein
MRGLFDRRWRNAHDGCAWCARPALNFEIDSKGEKVGACRAHAAQLTPIRHERGANLDLQAVRRDERIDKALKRRKK